MAVLFVAEIKPKRGNDSSYVTKNIGLQRKSIGSQFTTPMGQGIGRIEALGASVG
jgi:hypothetical protein